MNFNTEYSKIVRDVWEVKQCLKNLSNRSVRGSEIYRILHHLDLIAIKSVALAIAPHPAATKIDLYIKELIHVKPILTGNDLIRMGVSQGSRVGLLLNTLLYAKLDGKVNDRSDEEQLITAELAGFES